MLSQGTLPKLKAFSTNKVKLSSQPVGFKDLSLSLFSVFLIFQMTNVQLPIGIYLDIIGKLFHLLNQKFPKKEGFVLCFLRKVKTCNFEQYFHLKKYCNFKNILAKLGPLKKTQSLFILLTTCTLKKTCLYQKLSFLKTHSVLMIPIMIFLLPTTYKWM